MSRRVSCVTSIIFRDFSCYCGIKLNQFLISQKTICGLFPWGLHVYSALKATSPTWPYQKCVSKLLDLTLIRWIKSTKELLLFLQKPNFLPPNKLLDIIRMTLIEYLDRNFTVMNWAFLINYRLDLCKWTLTKVWKIYSLLKSFSSA